MFETCLLLYTIIIGQGGLTFNVLRNRELKPSLQTKDGCKGRPSSDSGFTL